ncbi:hypothetical protein KOW79_011923 [Hemibagrus wyckioides]|uniref:Uncharacterized protein n=1 Tax=Hemibagrus wyckioides TaxID=337641 RepID=A0A9D3NKG4_9TELE|nr:hypothetical protein KOW79_011923 [Hemibagrus wyckioides]
MVGSACAYPTPRGAGNPLNPIRDWDWGLQLFPMNEEFPVSAGHKLALIKSLPFVHTARRYYRSDGLVSVRGDAPAPPTRSRGSRFPLPRPRGREREPRSLLRSPKKTGKKKEKEDEKGKRKTDGAEGTYRSPSLRGGGGRRRGLLVPSFPLPLCGRRGEKRRAKREEPSAESPVPSRARGNVAYGSPHRPARAGGLSPSDGGSARGRCEAEVNGWGPHGPPGGFNPTVLIGRPRRRARAPLHPPRPSLAGGRAAGGGPPSGRGSSAAVGRISSAAVRRDRLRFGQEGSGDEGGSRARVRELYSAPPPPLRRLPPGPRATLTSAPSSRPSLERGGAGAGRGPSASDAAVDRAGLSSVRRPTAPRRPGRGPAHDTGAQGPRRRRPPNRPVLKHGPRSPTRARVRGPPHAKPHGAMKVKAGATPAEVGSARSPERRGAPPARLCRPVGEVEQERARWYPKDGELCPGRAKPEETLVEARSGPDVQIGRPTWV